MNTFCGRNAEFIKLKAGGTHGYPYTLLQLLEDEMRIYFRMSAIIPMKQTRVIYKTSLI
jgi:hypothetical protein